MNYCKILALLLLLYLIGLAPHQSSAESVIETIRNLAQGGPKSKPTTIEETSPSPTPGPETHKETNSGDSRVDTNPAVVEGTCDLVPNKCFDDVHSVTACVLPYARDDPRVLLVLNNGDGSLKLNVTVLPLNSNSNLEIPGRQAKKIKISSTVGGTSLLLNAVNWTCTIRLKVHVPLVFPSYVEYVTPINGLYLFLATALLIGGMWACCKFGKNERHLNGVPYQELEMGQQQSLSSTAVESADGWDQSWDDNWDEEKAVKSPSANHRGTRQANGTNSSSADDTNGWGNDWND